MLSDLLGPASRFICYALDLGHKWLIGHVELSNLLESSNEGKCFVQNVKVVNDAAEGSIKFYSEY